VRITGNTLTPAGVITGGIFAQPSNMGTFRRNEFSIVSEVGVRVGYQVTDYMRALVGYDFLYWMNVARPGEQIDRALGGGRPVFAFRSSDFWTHGLTAGLELRY
jgi:hypothetical protein